MVRLYYLPRPGGNLRCCCAGSALLRVCLLTIPAFLALLCYQLVSSAAYPAQTDSVSSMSSGPPSGDASLSKYYTPAQRASAEAILTHWYDNKQKRGDLGIPKFVFDSNQLAYRVRRPNGILASCSPRKCALASHRRSWRASSVPVRLLNRNGQF